MPAHRVSLAVAAFALLVFAPLHAPAFADDSKPLDLRSIVARVLLAHPAQQSAGQKVVEAQAHVAEASAGHRPQVTFTGQASGSHGRVAEPPSIQNFENVEGTLSLALPNARRLSAADAQARGGLKAAQAALTRTHIDLAFEATDAYYAVLRTRSARDIAAEDLSQAERQVSDAQKRVDAGDLPQADVLKAEVPVAEARVALAKAQNAVVVAEATLNSLLGRELSAPVALASEEQRSVVTMTRDRALADAESNSPDVREAQANASAAKAAVVVARHTHDPEFSLDATYAQTSDITAYSNLSTLTLNVSLPILDGGIARAQVRQAQAQYEQAQAALALATRQARLEAEQSWLEVRAAQVAVAGTKETLRIAEESLAKARQAYQAGLTTTRDVLDALNALSHARSDASGAVYDLAVALARLDQAVGKEPGL